MGAHRKEDPGAMTLTSALGGSATLALILERVRTLWRRSQHLFHPMMMLLHTWIQRAPITNATPLECARIRAHRKEDPGAMTLTSALGGSATLALILERARHLLTLSCEGRLKCG